MARITGTEERNGVMYYTTDTGAIVPVKAVLQSQHPNVDFDDMGQAVGGVPSADNEIDPKSENVFGDVAAQYGNEELQSAKDLLRNAGNVAAQSLPEELGILRNVISYPADMVNAGLLGALGVGQKAIALGAELMPGGTQSEKRLARDILGGADVAGVAPQGRMASALSAPAITAAKQFAPDAIGLGRGILKLDPEMIGEVFQKEGVPQSLGAARSDLFGYDNPGGDWLQGKIRRADHNIAEGGVGITGPTTAYTKESVMLPIQQLSSLKGALGENPSAGQPKFDDLMQSVKNEGFRNDSPSLVGVNHRGEPYIVEGNNRVAVAREMGIDRIPAEVRWYNGGEDVATNWSPQSVENMLPANTQKPLGFEILEQQARGNERLGGLLSQAGLDINDLSAANMSDLEKLLQTAVNRDILGARSANNLMRGLLR